MRKVFWLFAGLMFSSIAWCGAHNNHQVLTVFSPDSSRPCLFFQMDGVSEADPIVAASPWFAVPMSHNGYNLIQAMLLTLFTAGKNLNIKTTGGTACGFAEVDSVIFTFNR